MKTQHTPGPWFVGSTGGAPEVLSKERRIAKVLYHIGSEDTEVFPNARLIATAPDMLQTLRYILDLAEEDSKGIDGYGMIAEWARNQIRLATEE